MTGIRIDTRLMELVDLVVRQPDSKYSSSQEFVEEAIKYNIRRVSRASRKSMYQDRMEETQ